LIGKAGQRGERQIKQGGREGSVLQKGARHAHKRKIKGEITWNVGVVLEGKEIEEYSS